MKIAIPVGHSILKNGNCTSASGHVTEYTYCKELALLVADYLRKEGNIVDVIVCPEKKFKKVSEEKTYKLGRINGKKYDLVVELHLNAFNGTAKGTEVLYYSDKGKVYAQRVNDKLDDIFVDRDIKKRNDLYILKDTDCPAILVEAFFCDSKEDYMKADEQHEKKLIAKKLAEGILNRDIIETSSVSNSVKYGVKVYNFTTKESALNFSEKLKENENAYSQVDQNGTRWCVKVYTFTKKESAINFKDRLKEKYNAYSDVYSF